MVDKSVRGPYRRGGEKGPERPGAEDAPFEDERKQRFLAELEKTGLPVLARDAANVSAETVLRHRNTRPEFEAAYQHAMDKHRAGIERTIYDLGSGAKTKAIYWNGEVVGYEAIYDTKCLLAYAKRHIPEYRESLSVEQHTHHTGGVAVGLADLGKLSRPQRELLRQLLLTEQPKK